MIYPMVLFPVTLSDLNVHFKVTVYALDVLCAIAKFLYC